MTAVLSWQYDAVMYCMFQKQQSYLTPNIRLQGKSVPNIGAWADLQDQLQRRRAELNGQAPHKTSTPSTSAAQQAKGGKAITANGAESTAQTSGAVLRDEASISLLPKASTNNVAVPTAGGRGAVRPRGGVRASAMGPLLNFLRNSGGLTT